MAYGAYYLRGTRFFDRGSMIAGPSSSFRPLAYWDSSLRALPALKKKIPARPGKALATTERKGSM